MKKSHITILFVIQIANGYSQKSSPGIEIYNSNICELLDFQNDQNDLSGITAVKVKLNQTIKSKAKSYNWTLKDDKVLADKKSLESVILKAHKPGLSVVYYEVFDKNNRSLGTAEIPVSVPLFVKIKEYSNYQLALNAIPKGVNPSEAQKFDAVLKYSFLIDKKRKILENTQKLSYEIYKNINVRLVFESLDQKIPTFYDSTGTYSKVLLQGFAREYGLGPTPNAAIGFAPFKTAFVNMGRITDRYTIFALNNQTKSLHSFQYIFDFFKDKTVPQSRKNMVIPFWQEVFTKILTFTICHELGHTLLPDDYVHTDTSLHPDDIMASFYEDKDIGLEKKEQIDWRTFALPGTYRWSKMQGFNSYNQKLISDHLPTCQYPQFSKFFSLNK